MTDTPNPPLQGQEYRSLSKLYSKDGKRCADVLEFQNGETYLDEQEWVEGTTFKNRHSGSLVGPFASAEDAEKFIVATPWFRGPRRMWRPIVLTTTAVLVLIAAISIIAWWVRHSPTRDDAKLTAMSAEAHTLMTLGPTQDWRGIPKNRWPPTIASLNPQWVRVDNWGVEVLIEGFFDGGWGYDIVPNGRKPPMPIECYQNLGRGIYWHDPC